jgi:hypothetical protein
VCIFQCYDPQPAACIGDVGVCVLHPGELPRASQGQRLPHTPAALLPRRARCARGGNTHNTFTCTPTNAKFMLLNILSVYKIRSMWIA